MSDPRPMTKEEMRDELLRHLVGVARYWAYMPNENIRRDYKLPELREDPSVVEAYMRHAAEGALFSILTTFDGSSADMPAFDIVARPQPEDEAYMRDIEEANWWEDGEVLNDDTHLHELLHRFTR